MIVVPLLAGEYVIAHFGLLWWRAAREMRWLLAGGQRQPSVVQATGGLVASGLVLV